ncbi:DUF3275 family protein [Salmonella enterica]|nr:DUF3275 family protein [Salmonella enterica subsp. diarizonae serovar 42:l,v:1,5,7]
MNTSSPSPFIINGKLVIKTINGRNGAFNVGLLETSIGSFSVKDRELEQYTAGVYQGQFVIGRIFMHAWSYGANSGTEIRARLDEMTIETNCALNPGDEQKMLPPVSDPLDEESRTPEPPAPDLPVPVAETPVPAAKQVRSKRTQFTVPTPAEQEQEDRSLFGALWPLGDIVKLDSAAPRQVLRRQTARLGLLGYEFCAQEQHFVKTAASGTVLH